MSNSTEIIGRFAQAAIEHALVEGARQMPTPSASFRVAGVTVALHEPRSLAVDWLSGQFDPPDAEATYRIYCDDSNWQAVHGPSARLLEGLSTLDMDRILAEKGLMGSFFAPLNHWDLFDPATATGIRLQTTPGTHLEWEPTAPLAPFLNWIMRAEKKVVLHAATLGNEGVGVFLAGSGGSGKSGTTLAGVLNGLSSVGDDYCVVDLSGSVTAYPFFRKMKQDQTGLDRVGITLDSAIFGVPNWQKKLVFDQRAVAPESVVDALAIRAVLLPKITQAKRTEIKPAPSLELFRALCPSTMKQLAGDRRVVFEACAEIARRMPGFHLRLGTDPVEITNVISNFIQMECL